MVETSLKYATVVGRFVSVIGDSPDDDDDNPDVVPLHGTVTFTAKPKAVFGVGADGEPVTINMRRRIVARLDGQGYLTVNGVRGVRLLANDSPGINPAGFTYHVSFSLNDRGQQQFDYDAFDISVPYSDTPHNLLTLSPVPANPGEPILQGVGLTRVSFNGEGAFVFDYTNGVQQLAPFPANVVQAIAAEVPVPEVPDTTALERTVTEHGTTLTSLTQTVIEQGTMLAGQGATLTDLERTVTEHGTTLTNVRGAVTEQGTTLASVQSRVTEQDGALAYGSERIDALEAPRVTVEELFSETPFYIAHRGSGDVFPEHTLEAYTGALAQGAKAIEVSVHLTADGVPVCLHDSTLDRTTGLPGAVADYTLAELRNVRTDMRSFLGPNTVRAEIPTLEDVLDAIAGDAVLFIEAKVSRAQAPMLAMLTERNLGASAVVKMYRNGDGRFDGNAGFAGTAKAAGFVTWCYVDATDGIADIDTLANSAGVDAIGVPYFENLPAPGASSMTDDQVRAVVALGKPVICWEIHRRAARDRAVSLGVRGIMCSNWLWVAAPEKYTSTVTDFRRGIRWPGAVPGGSQDASSMPSWDTATGRLVMSQQYDASFLLSPLSNHSRTTYTINVSMGWLTAAPTTGSLHAGVVFGAESDEAWGFSAKHANAKAGSYMLIWRGSGSLDLMKYAPGATSGVLLGKFNGPAPADGLFLTFHIAVTPEGITITADGVTGSITTTDTAYRGRYVHVVKNHSITAAGPFALTAASITN